MVEELQNIKDNLKSILSTVEGIGLVYDHFLDANHRETFNRYFVKDDVVNTTFFTQKSRTGTYAATDELYKFEREFEIWMYHSYSADSESDNVFDVLIENVIIKLNSFRTLNTYKHGGVNMIIKGYAMFGNVLCHYAKLTVSIPDTDEYLIQ